MISPPTQAPASPATAADQPQDLCCVVIGGDTTATAATLTGLADTDLAMTTVLLWNQAPPVPDLPLPGQAHVFDNRPPEHPARALNRCLTLVVARYTAVVAAGETVAPQALLNAVLHLDDHPEVGMLTLVPADRDRPPVLRPRWLPASPTLFRQDMLGETGLYRPGSGLYQRDLCRTARRLGWHLAYFPAPGVRRPTPAPCPRGHRLFPTLRYLLWGLVRHRTAG